MNRTDKPAAEVRAKIGGVAQEVPSSETSLIDTVLGTAVRSAFQTDIGPLTIDLNVSFLRPSGKGRIYACATIVKKGRQVRLFVEGANYYRSLRQA